jgi:hypothetical protein
MQRKYIIYIAFILFSSQSIAAGPITHAYLAQKWIKSHEHFSQQEEESFMRGTLFPDIRYLGIITREDTHYNGVTLEGLLQDKSPFSKGKKLHSFVDEKREEFVVKSKIYDKIKTVPEEYRGTFLKFLEDEVLYQKGNWEKIRLSLGATDETELVKIEKEHIIRWHQMTQEAFCAPPSQYFINIKKFPFLIKEVNGKKFILNIPTEIIKKWSVILPTLAKDKDIETYVNNLTKQFDEMWET